jgi:hypothetical protein
MGERLDSTDAEVWAAEFVDTFRGQMVVDSGRLDTATIAGWFANAIEAGRRSGRQEAGWDEH